MRLSVALALAITPLAAPAAAQDVAGSRKDAELEMATFARCEVGSRQGRAAALAFTREVEGTPSTYPERLIRGTCLRTPGAKLRFKPGLFRMALFPALYRRDYGKAPPLDLAAAPTPDYAREFDGTPGDETLMLRRFGDCVVRGDAANARAFVLTELYSGAEAATVAALQPTLGTCVAAGQQLHFSRSVLRGAVAESLYKLSVATGGQKAG